MNTRCLSFANSSVSLVSQGERAASLVDFLFPDSVDCEADSSPVIFQLEPGTQGSDFNLSVNVSTDTWCGDFGQMAVFLMERVCYHLADGSSGGLLFHAACLSKAGKTLVLSGPSGSGKSTLAVWLARRNFHLGGDELTFIPQGSLDACALTRPVYLKPSAENLFPGLVRQTAIPVQPRSDLLGGWLCPPSALHGSVEQPGPVSKIVFPKFTPGANLHLECLSRASAAVALTGLLVNARNLPDHGFPELLRLVRLVPAYRLCYGSFDQIGSHLDDLLFASSEPESFA